MPGDGDVAVNREVGPVPAALLDGHGTDHRLASPGRREGLVEDDAAREVEDAEASGETLTREIADEDAELRPAMLRDDVPSRLGAELDPRLVPDDEVVEPHAAVQVRERRPTRLHPVLLLPGLEDLELDHEVGRILERPVHAHRHRLPEAVRP